MLTAPTMAPAAPPAPWAGSASVPVPPMETPSSLASEKPESASVTLLRSLVADRRRVKSEAEAKRDGLLRSASEYENAAADAKRFAEETGLTVAAAEAEISAILADIKKLGGRAE